MGRKWDLIKYELLGFKKPMTYAEMYIEGRIQNAEFHLRQIMKGKSNWNFDYFAVLSAMDIDSKLINKVLLSLRNQSYKVGK